MPDALPLVAPSYDHVLGNLDDDPQLEIVGGLVSGDVEAYEADGSRRTVFDSSPGGGEHVDKSKVLNLFENPIAADLDGLPGLEVMRGGLTLNGLVNLGIAVGQNLPYNHVVQAWSGATGQSLPAYPQAVEDYQLLSSPSVADVSDAPGRELLVGTGLYLLRNINATGVEGAGFPKFTGGWIFAVPAVGDVDGDNKLDIATLTREGNAFVWKTESPVCGTNDEWWTSRHDERSTGAHGTDTRPPAVPSGIGLSGSRLRWTVPGDDWQCGAPSRVRVLTADSPITGAADGAVLVDEAAEGTAGDAASRAVATDVLRAELAVVYRDEAGNWGRPARISRDGEPLGPTPVAPPGAKPPAAGGAPAPGGGSGARDGTAPDLRVTAPRFGPFSGRVRVRWRSADAVVLPRAGPARHAALPHAARPHDRHHPAPAGAAREHADVPRHRHGRGRQRHGPPRAHADPARPDEPPAAPRRRLAPLGPAPRRLRRQRGDRAPGGSARRAALPRPRGGGLRHPARPARRPPQDPAGAARSGGCGRAATGWSCSAPRARRPAGRRRGTPLSGRP